jgi:pimeloyl-ACP methyl ester carboxylesterase
MKLNSGTSFANQHFGPILMTESNTASRSYQHSTTLQINYEVHGQGEPLVLLHGFGASLETWRDIVPFLVPYYTLYLIDLKGCGLSSKPHDHRYSPNDQGAIVAGFLQTVVGKKTVLIGNSYGGGVALKTFLRLEGKHLVSHLVLIDAAAYPQTLPLYIEVLRWPIINRLILQLPARWRARIVLKKAFSDVRKVTTDRVARHAKFLSLPGSDAALIEIAKQLLPSDSDNFVNQIRTIDAPTLLLWGRQDRIIPPATADRLHKDLKDSTLLFLENTGHAPQEEQPETTASRIREFLLFSTI